MDPSWFLWWSDSTGLDRAQVVLGAASLLATIGLGIVAWWLARRQVEISMRQTDIAEAHDKFFQEQLAKKTDLRVLVQGINTRAASVVGNLIFTVKFHVHNGGNKSADGFYWEILVPEDIAHWTKFVDEDGSELNGQISHQTETEHYMKIDGHYTNKLWGYTGLEVVRIAFVPFNDILDQFVVRWRIRGEDGMVPPEGLAFIKLKRHDKFTYGWSEWYPGQKETDIQ